MSLIFTPSKITMRRDQKDWHDKKEEEGLKGKFHLLIIRQFNYEYKLQLFNLMTDFTSLIDVMV